MDFLCCFRFRNSREDSEFETDSTCSDGGVVKLSRSSSDCSNRTWDSEDSGSDQEADSKIKERLGRLYFQYFETAGPHLRPPLRDMVKILLTICSNPMNWELPAMRPFFRSFFFCCCR